MGYYFKVQNYRRIGLDLHAARIMLGWGTGELASLSGVDEKTIIRIESLKPHDKLSVNLEHVSLITKAMSEVGGLLVTGNGLIWKQDT